MAKKTNPMKVITGPDTRWSYANVWEPKAINGGTPKFSVSLIIKKDDGNICLPGFFFLFLSKAVETADCILLKTAHGS